MDGASGFEDLAPSCGTGADGDYSDPGGLMVCGICLFPSNACICEPRRNVQGLMQGRSEINVTVKFTRPDGTTFYPMIWGLKRNGNLTFDFQNVNATNAISVQVVLKGWKR